MMDNRQTQVFGDGNKLYIIFKNVDYINGKSNLEYAWVIDNPIVYTISSNTIGERTPLNLINLKGNKTMINIDLSTTNVDIKTGKNLMFNLDMFKNIKVSELFVIINKKLKQRDKNENDI